MTLSWKEKLTDRIAPELAGEIDQFERQMALRRQGKIEDKVFAEIRLRRGVYGQRYDNGQRHDGEKTQDIPFPAERNLDALHAWRSPLGIGTLE